MNTTPEVVAHRFPPHLTDEMICTDPECLARYADLMATVGIPMTATDVWDWQNNRDGKIAYCSNCSVTLDGLAA